MDSGIIFSIVLSMIFLIFMVLITFYLVLLLIKKIVRTKREKKTVKMLEFGYEVVTVDSSGLPCVMKNKNKYTTLNLQGGKDDLL